MILKQPVNANLDVISLDREQYVREIVQNLGRFKDNGCPFKDKRKQIFKGITDLEHGDKYQGSWIVLESGEQVIHGRGVYIYANGSQYIGWFKEGNIIGQGRLVYYNGDIYEGYTENMKYSGHGKYVFGESHPIKGQYEGEFEDGKITGEGLFKIESRRPLTKIFGKVEFLNSQAKTLPFKNPNL